MLRDWGQSQEPPWGSPGAPGTLGRWDTTSGRDRDKGQRTESLLEEERFISESLRKTGAGCPEIRGPRGPRCGKRGRDFR